MASVPTSLRSNGGGGDNDDMDDRIKALESAVQGATDRLTRIETTLEHIPTKGDLADAMTAQLKWIVGTPVVLGAAALIIMTFVLNNAIPIQTQSAQAPTIIVNVPPSVDSPPPPTQ